MEKGVDYIVTPSNNMFVTAKRRPGLLPQVLQDLLAARKKAKADLKQETDPLRYAFRSPIPAHMVTFPGKWC